jgi:hypothetical protein
MLLLSKIALGIGCSALVATAYVFHDGVMRISVDEYRPNGSHVHLYLPAAVLPIAAHLAPRQRVAEALHEAHDVLPAVNIAFRELGKYPDADFVEVKDADEHVQIRTRGGKLLIDIESPRETVHLACPIPALVDLFDELESARPGS